MYYTVAWTTLELGSERSNVLVCGGTRGEVRMFHPKNKVCYHTFRPDGCKNEDEAAAGENVWVYSLVFHSERPTWLFCK